MRRGAADAVRRRCSTLVEVGAEMRAVSRARNLAAGAGPCAAGRVAGIVALEGLTWSIDAHAVGPLARKNAAFFGGDGITCSFLFIRLLGSAGEGSGVDIAVIAERADANREHGARQAGPAGIEACLLVPAAVGGSAGTFGLLFSTAGIDAVLVQDPTAFSNGLASFRSDGILALGHTGSFSRDRDGAVATSPPRCTEAVVTSGSLHALALTFNAVRSADRGSSVVAAGADENAGGGAHETITGNGWAG